MAAGDAPVTSPGPMDGIDLSTQPRNYVGCALCGTTPTRVMATEDRYGLPTKVVACLRCGLQYINPRMTADAYAAFYQGTYRALIASLAGVPPECYDVQVDQWQYARALATEVAAWMPTGGTLVDVGGSTGIIARRFRTRFGPTPVVIDPSQTELARAEAKGCHTICASAETAVFPSSDVALLCRTVDHLLDPLGVLRRLRDVARVLVVDAMDVDHWPLRWRYKVDHPYAFTRQTLRAMVTAAGWVPCHEWTRRDGHYVGLVCSSEETGHGTHV